MTLQGEHLRNIEVVWGCAEIAKVIGRSTRATFHMLEKGELPARKVGKRWVAERGKLLRFLIGDAA